MRRIITWVLILSILVSSFSITYASGIALSDINKHWAKASILWLVDQRLVAGYPDGTFKPNNSVSVIEFIKLVTLGAGYKLESGQFIWYENYLKKALEIGLLVDGEYPNLNAPMTREQVAKMVALAVAHVEEVPDSTLDELVRINIRDFAKIGDEYKQYVINAYKMGLLAGNPDGFFNPQGTLTRAETATIIQRLMDKTKRQPFKPENGYGIILNNIYTGNRYVVSRPERKEEIGLAYLLDSTSTRSKDKGWYFVSYNPDIIGSIFFDSKEAFEEGKNSPIGINAETVHAAIEMDFSGLTVRYSLIVYNVAKMQSMDRAVLVDVMKYLFKADSDKAIALFDKYSDYCLTGVDAQKIETVKLNNKKVEFYKPEGANTFQFQVLY